MTRSDLTTYVSEALHANGGSATIVEIARRIWDQHRADLETSGELFYTWQYDMRWAATRLREDGKLKPAETSPKGVWELKR